MKENKKRVIISLTIGVALLIMLIISSTYAYFQIMTSGSSSTLITGSTPEGSNFSVKELLGELHLNLSASDMAYANQGDYYADDQDNYVKTQEDGTHDIAEVSLVGDTQTYYCTGKINIEMDITPETSMGAAIQDDDLFLHLEGAGLNETVDLFDIKDTGTTSYYLDFEITGGSKETINGYAKLVNKETDQKYLANKELSIAITVSDVNCEIPETLTNLELLQLAKSTSDSGLNSNLKGDLYRYSGNKNNVKNYICFGTRKKCNEIDDEMYRIIGFTSDGKIKIIKNTNLKFMMWSDKTEDRTWEQSEIFKSLNGVEETSFYNSLDEKYKNYISTENWYSPTSASVSSIDSLYSFEISSSSEKVSAKIGIMSASDYAYSVSKDGRVCVGLYEGPNCVSSWLHISNNGDEKTKTSDEWILYRYGYRKSGTYYAIWFLGDEGGFMNVQNTSTEAVRPVFYLNNNLNISGSGTIEDPYIIISSN